MWSDYRERLPDGSPKVTLDEILDYNEMLAIDGENERRAHKAAEAEARRKNRKTQK